MNTRRKRRGYTGILLTNLRGGGYSSYESLCHLPGGGSESWERSSMANPQTSAPVATQPPQPAAVAVPIEEHVEPEVSFWQEPWVQNGLPIVTSILVHAGLILLGFLTYTAYKQAVTVSQEQIIVPDAAIVAGDVGGIPNPGLDGDPNRPAASDLVPENSQSEGWNKLPSQSMQAAVLGGSGDTESDTIIGVGAGSSIGKGKGIGVGSGDGEGAAAPFGVPGGGRGIGPKSNFMGVSGNAKTVAYVCDASGSMIGLPFDLLKIELKKAVEGLYPIQAFNIIFFQEGDAASLSKTLLVANPNNKQKAYQYLQDVRERAMSDPLKSLKLAFAQQPQLIYLLTDGAFDDNDAVINEIRKLNAAKKTHINTIAFFSPEQQTAERKACEDVLRTIASENGGQFKVVYTTDLMKQ